MFIHTDAPPGSGLGGSSTVIVCILGAMSEWLGVPMTQYEIAHLAYHLEREELGLRGGKQDQYAAAFGGFNYIEFKRDDVIVTPLRVRKDILHELHYSMLLCYTGKTRQSANIIESQMDNYRSGQNEVALDAAKRLAEEAKDALLRGEIRHLGEILDRSWEQKKLFSSSISNDVIDTMYGLAKSNGAIGGKISGAGGGGYMFFLCDYDRKHMVAKELVSHGAIISDFNFEKDGLQTWRYRQ
jgi:D-glycero-alpha-D-manno-heptose-7-phosphate kinase